MTSNELAKWIERIQARAIKVRKTNILLWQLLDELDQEIVDEGTSNEHHRRIAKKS